MKIVLVLVVVALEEAEELSAITVKSPVTKRLFAGKSKKMRRTTKLILQTMNMLILSFTMMKSCFECRSVILNYGGVLENNSKLVSIFFC